MHFKNLGAGAFVTLFGAVAVLTLATPAAAQEPSDASANTDTIVVCEGNELSTVDADGQPVPQDVLTIQLDQVQRLCQTDKTGIVPFGSFGYAYLAARANYTPATASVHFTSDASSIPKGTHTLSCIYRSEPTSGSAGSWQTCGTTYGSASSLMTSTASFCPVPGTRWHANAALYKGKGGSAILKQRDDAYVIAG